mgnify:CR=1 FL=1
MNARRRASGLPAVLLVVVLFALPILLPAAEPSGVSASLIISVRMSPAGRRQARLNRKLT